MAIAAGTTKYAKRKTPRAAAMRTADDMVAEPDTGGGEDGDGDPNDKLVDQLSELMCDRMREAIIERDVSGIEEEWREAEDLYEGYDELNNPDKGRLRIPDKNSTARRGGPESGGQATLILNITKPKVKSITARVKEMLVPAGQKPFDLSPTPVPEFDALAKDPKLAGTNVTLGDGTQAPALAVAQITQEKMTAATKAEMDWVEDRFVEGRVYGEFRRVITDAARVGTGVLKGPYPVCQKTRKWEVTGNVAKLIIEDKPEPTSSRIRVQDCFPDPACGDNIHDGAYFCERDFVTAKVLRDLAKDPTYDQKAIAQAVLEGPMTTAMLRAAAYKERRVPGDMKREAALYELWYCYGDVPPDYLIAIGVKDSLLGNGPTSKASKAANDEPDDGPDAEDSTDADGASPTLQDAEAAFDPSTKKKVVLTPEEQAALASVPAMVTMLNGRAIKAVIQPLESGEFPYDFFRWERVDGQPFGRGAAIQMRAAQVILKQGVRRLLENAGQSSGPQIVIADCVEPVNGRNEVTGRKLWRFIPTELIDDVRKAMAFFTIPSVQAELMAIITMALDMADRLTNFPMLMQGDQQAGTAPETLGGLKLFENNATSPLRDIAAGWDDDVVIPHIGRYHEWFMLNVPDMAKGDAQIKALGSTALIQREEGRAFLMMLAPVKDDPDYRINPAKYAAELARANGYDMGLIQYTDDEWKKVQQQKAQQPAAPPIPVAVAQIKAKTDEDAIASKERMHAADLAQAQNLDAQDQRLKMAIAQIDQQIAEMNLSGKTNVSLMDIKAMLAAKASDLAIKRQEMQFKLSPLNVSHTGI